MMRLGCFSKSFYQLSFIIYRIWSREPAVRCIFFVIANSVKQSVELFSNRNNKKGCRFHQG